MVRWSNDAEMADEDIRRRDRCHTLLVDAGSDCSSISPEIISGARDFVSSAFGTALRLGSLVTYSYSDLSIADIANPT